jgi:hypothetical protein
MASSSGQDKERERKAQERDHNLVRDATAKHAHKEIEAAHPGNISSDSSTVIGKGRDRRAGPKK